MNTDLEHPASEEQPSVGFTAMTDGTAEDYRLLRRYEDTELARFPDRVLSWLRNMDDHSGYQVTRLQHCLQAATRAYRAGEDEETVVCALVHDIGDMLGPANHSEVAAAVLRPYVSERNYWVVKHHGVFQASTGFTTSGPTRTPATAGPTTPGTRTASTSAPTTTRTHSTRTIPPNRWSSSSPCSAVCSHPSE